MKLKFFFFNKDECEKKLNEMRNALQGIPHDCDKINKEIHNFLTIIASALSAKIEKNPTKTLVSFMHLYKNKKDNSCGQVPLFRELYELLLKSFYSGSWQRTDETHEAYRIVLGAFEIYKKKLKKLQKLQKKTKYFPHEFALEDSKGNYFNFSIPIVFTDLENHIHAETESKYKRTKGLYGSKTIFRYVINSSGIIMFGFDNPRETETYHDEELWQIYQAKKRLNNKDTRYLTYSIVHECVVAVCSHAALNNYQPVIAAGKVTYDFKKKQFKNINSYSGHYKPHHNALQLAYKIFKENFPDHTKNMEILLT